MLTSAQHCVEDGSHVQVHMGVLLGLMIRECLRILVAGPFAESLDTHDKVADTRFPLPTRGSGRTWPGCSGHAVLTPDQDTICLDCHCRPYMHNSTEVLGLVYFTPCVIVGNLQGHGPDIHLVWLVLSR